MPLPRFDHEVSSCTSLAENSTFPTPLHFHVNFRKFSLDLRGNWVRFVSPEANAVHKRPTAERAPCISIANPVLDIGLVEKMFAWELPIGRICFQLLQADDAHFWHCGLAFWRVSPYPVGGSVRCSLFNSPDSKGGAPSKRGSCVKSTSCWGE